MSTPDFFRSRLDAMIDLRHPLAVLANRMPWTSIEATLTPIFERRAREGRLSAEVDLFGTAPKLAGAGHSAAGRPRLSTRLMVGLLYLKHAYNESDESVCERWAQDVYFQYFCGEDYFQPRLPCDPTNLVRFRQALGEAGVEEMLATTIAAAVQMKAVRPAEFERVIVDTTVQEKAIAYPTDSRLLEVARGKLARLAQRAGLTLKQTYQREGKQLRRRAGGYAHAKQFKRLRRVLKRQRTILGRLLRDIERKLSGASAEQQASLRIWLERAWRICRQRAKDKHKLYALHAPEVECISKGKARQPYEFGVKVSLAITEKQGLIVGARSFAGNPYDGHTLAAQLEQTNILLQDLPGTPTPKIVLADLGFRGVDADVAPVQLIHRGKHKALSSTQRKWLKRRQAIEPIIGHVKQEHGMRRCWLKGQIGDALHAVLCAAGYNLRWLLRAIVRLGLAPIFFVLAWLRCWFKDSPEALFAPRATVRDGKVGLRPDRPLGSTRERDRILQVRLKKIKMTANENIQTNLESRLKDLTQENDLLLRQVHHVQQELERHYRRHQERENIKSEELQGTSVQDEWTVGDERTEVLAENRRLRALVETQRKIHRLEAQNALNVKLGDILVQGVGSPGGLLSMPAKLGKIWWGSSRQVPPKSLGGKDFKKVVAAYRHGGFVAVEKLLAEASALPAVQASAYTVLARQLMNDGAYAYAADAAHRAYALDPKPYRLKWLAFRLHDAENYVEAEAMLDILPPNTSFSESEARQADQLRHDARYFRQNEVEQRLPFSGRNEHHKEAVDTQIDLQPVQVVPADVRPNADHRVSQELPYFVNPEYPGRLSIDDLFSELARYELISFDVFDTAIHRTVEKPADVFRILAARSGISEFMTIRKQAEAYARSVNDRMLGTREVTLGEIYEVLEWRYGVDRKWEQAEADLEIELCRPNAYIKAVFDRLKAMGKTLVFMSDMYLPHGVLDEMLAKCGYDGFAKIYLSNEHKKRKGDGTLQKVLLDEYGQQHSIVHVGDVYTADVEKSVEAGISAIYSADQRCFIRENDMDNLAGSFYRAVINNFMGTGVWDKGLHYSHGFRVGGILTLGYCEFIERTVREKAIDKILFLGRDCDVISKAYRQYYGATASEYVGISRYAILGLTIDRNYGDFINRSFFRWFRESNNSRSIEQLLVETGFACLIEHLEAFDIDKFLPLLNSQWVVWRVKGERKLGAGNP